jgi:condensin complex subunit 3
LHKADYGRSSAAKKSKQEAMLDDDIDNLLEADVTQDSIMDSEEEDDDEDEVNSILASDEEP